MGKETSHHKLFVCAGKNNMPGDNHYNNPSFQWFCEINQLTLVGFTCVAQFHPGFKHVLADTHEHT